jgi:hypothetical protein
MVTPGGREPEATPNTNVPRPPVVETVALYDAPREPFGSVELVIVRGVVTPSVSAAVVDCGGTEESVAWKVSV